MRQRFCPYCDQPLPEYRLGVKLPPLKARIYDLVLRGGRDGIAAEDLWQLTYSNSMPNGKGIRAARDRDTLKSHIQQINELIEDAGYRIVCCGRHWRSACYRLERRR